MKTNIQHLIFVTFIFPSILLSITACSPNKVIKHEKKIEQKISKKMTQKLVSPINLKAKSSHIDNKIAIRPKKNKKIKDVCYKKIFSTSKMKNAQYVWINKKVLIKEARDEIKIIPAQYKTVIKKVKLAKNDQEYKIISHKVLVSPAKKIKIYIPEKYKTIQVKQLVKPIPYVPKKIRSLWGRKIVCYNQDKIN